MSDDLYEGNWSVGINQRASYRWNNISEAVYLHANEPVDINKRVFYYWVDSGVQYRSWVGSGVQYLRADGTWSTSVPQVTVMAAKEPDPPGTAATLALGAAALAAKNPVVSRRFWGRK